MEPNKDLAEWVDFLVETTKAFKQAKADGKLDLSDLLLLVPVFTKIGPAVDGSSKIQLDSISSDDLKSGAFRILEAAGDNDPKLHAYILESLNIISDVTKIVHAIQRIKEVA